MNKTQQTILRQYLFLALFVVLARVVFRVIYGNLSLEVVSAAAIEGSKLAAWVLGFGLLNLLVDFKKLIRRFPRFLRNFGTALTIALNLTPEMAKSVGRVRSAAKLRAHRKGVHLVRSVVVPVLSNAIDQSIQLADSMDSRGFGQKLEPAQGDIVLNSLTFGYNTNERLLDDVSINIPQGNFCLITGNTGSGKTTLLRVIQAKIPGSGFVSQFPRQGFVSDTVADELSFSLAQLSLATPDINSIVLETAEKFGLDLQANIHELSAGWQQRVAIASALVSGSKILLLDEPFSALDTSGTKMLVELLQKLKKDGVTIVLAEHRIGLIEHLSDQKLRIESGALDTDSLPRSPLQKRIPKRGKVQALVGENGSGKTSYLRKLAETAGVLVPQPPGDLLFLDTVRAELIQSDLDSQKPLGFTEEIFKKLFTSDVTDRNPRDLSEGQKLCLALSIQLAKDSKLLLLDEPTLGLDPLARQALVEIMSALADSGVEFIVATHDTEFAGAIATETLPIELAVKLVA